jgi:hypothetical protein
MTISRPNGINASRSQHGSQQQGGTALSGRYCANITAGSLKIPESRVIADLLLRGYDDAGWFQAIAKNNLLKAKNPVTARRIARLIRQRLDSMSPDLWRLIRDGTVVVATHAVLAAAIKHSFLLGDFLLLVVGDQYRRFGKNLTKKLWFDFLEDCHGRCAPGSARARPVYAGPGHYRQSWDLFPPDTV